MLFTSQDDTSPSPPLLLRTSREIMDPLLRVSFLLWPLPGVRLTSPHSACGGAEQKQNKAEYITTTDLITFPRIRSEENSRKPQILELMKSTSCEFVQHVRQLSPPLLFLCFILIVSGFLQLPVAPAHHKAMII